MQAREFAVEAIGEPAQFLTGIAAGPIDGLFVRVELAQALGAVVEVQRQSRPASEGPEARYGQSAGDAGGRHVPAGSAWEEVI